MSLKEYELMNQIEKEDNIFLLKVKGKKDGQIYLLKTILLQSLTQKEKINAIKEIKLLYSLNHPNIIKYKRHFLDSYSNSLNILMEFPNNGILSQKIDYAKKNDMYMEENIIWNVLTQILNALNYANKRGIIHKNLKSKNIYLTKFRLAKISYFDKNYYLNKNNNLNNKIEHFLYTAPEILISNNYNYKCDIWSLGCIIYEMVTLTLPFNGKNIKELFNNIRKGKYRQISNFYSNNLKVVINSMLMFDPSKRPSFEIMLNFPNIKEFSNQLKNNNPIYYNYHNNIILKNNNNIELLNRNKTGSVNNNIKQIFGKKNQQKFKIKSRTTANSRNLTRTNSLSKGNIITKTSSHDKNNTMEIKIHNSTYRTIKERKIFYGKSKGNFHKNNIYSRNHLYIDNFGNISKHRTTFNNKNNIFNNIIKISLNNNIGNINNNKNIKNINFTNNNFLMNRKLTKNFSNNKSKSKCNIINFSNDNKNKKYLSNNVSSNDFINEKSYKLINIENSINYLDKSLKNNKSKILSNKNLTKRILKYNFNKKELQNKINNYTKNEKEKNKKNNKPFKKEIFIDNDINNFSFSDKIISEEKLINDKKRLYYKNKINSAKKKTRNISSRNPLYSSNLTKKNSKNNFPTKNLSLIDNPYKIIRKMHGDGLSKVYNTVENNRLNNKNIQKKIIIRNKNKINKLKAITEQTDINNIEGNFYKEQCSPIKNKIIRFPIILNYKNLNKNNLVNNQPFINYNS